MNYYDYAFLISVLRNNFQKGEEQIILKLVVHTQRWLLCRASKESIAAIATQFVCHLNETMDFEVVEINGLMVTIKSTATGDDLLKFLTWQEKVL